MSLSQTNTPQEFRVIETLGWSAQTGAQRLDRHLVRMSGTCAALGISFPKEQLLFLINDVSSDHDLRIRLTVDRDGQGALEQWPLAKTADHWTVAIADQRVDSADRWLGHKTTMRALYDTARGNLPAGIDEWIFLNERGEVCEGTITNLFVQDGDRLLTPPRTSGLLPGILRAELLDLGRAVEADLTVSELERADAIFCGNALRGLIKSTLIRAE
ncbi:aminotransferase class IV family protein [Pacificibacter marinus]|uniref:aminotransferase class IV family protein n=1 Tax=Pacificibacter marinus TaxID=658057 RepID=UPI001C0761BA|nr:aminotransferase class IV family protein [Pacificibacter marinus]MBU2865543.1 aminotransferase class IV family protein [Pacificibacter marinus]